MAGAGPDGEVDEKPADVESPTWAGSLTRSMSAPSEPPPTRALHIDSTIRRMPAWRIEGRGDDRVIEFTVSVPLGASLTGFRPRTVKARILCARPVPKTARDPDNFMTHLLEYIVGGHGQEWVRLDEEACTIRFEGEHPFTAHPLDACGHATSPMSSGNQAVAVDEQPESPPDVLDQAEPPQSPNQRTIKYTLKESNGELSPAPGQYGIVSVATRFRRDPIVVLGERPLPSPPASRDTPQWRERQKLIQERRARAKARFEENRTKGPDMMSYTPTAASSSPMATRMPVYSFGSSSRSPKARATQSPEPGCYELPSCLSGGRAAAIRSRVERDYTKDKYKILGLEPGYYDTSAGFRHTMPRNPCPKWKRSKSDLDRSMAFPSCAPAPGTYDSSFTLTHRRDRVAMYHKEKGQTRLPKELPPDPHFANFTIMPLKPLGNTRRGGAK